MSTKSKTAGAIAALAIIGAALVATPAQASTVHIDDGWAVAAPHKGAKGAIFGGSGNCKGSQSPSTKEVIFRIPPGKNQNYINTPGIKIWTYHNDDVWNWHTFSPGRYGVNTTVHCPDGSSGTKKQVLIVKTLKDSQTISKGERRRIKKGMSKEKIEKIIGGKLKYEYKSGKTKSYGKDSTTLGAWYVLDFKHGKLVHVHRLDT